MENDVAIPKESESILYYYGYSCYNHGQWQKAIATFRGLAMFFPHKGSYWYGLGSSHMMNGNDIDASHAFEIASIHLPDDPRPFAYWAECLARLGKHELALDIIKKAEEKAKTNDFAGFLNQIELIKERMVEVRYG